MFTYLFFIAAPLLLVSLLKYQNFSLLIYGVLSIDFLVVAEPSVADIEFACMDKLGYFAGCTTGGILTWSFC